jgi:hypothetical protein
MPFNLILMLTNNNQLLLFFYFIDKQKVWIDWNSICLMKIGIYKENICSKKEL